MNNKNESVVLIGGGGGVYRVARFLKHLRSNITTIQTVFDHGRHSGELRDERGMLPPGDIRQAILALADDQSEPMLRQLMAFRFAPKNGSSLDDATVGNILLTALTEITGNINDAISILSRWCGVKGKVLPVSLDDADLCVKLNDGEILCGEDKIDARSISDDRTIISAHLKPSARIYEEAREAILRAGKIVFCPGDLYTSLIPNTLVSGFKEAVNESKAKLIFAVNIMTKKAETPNFSASQFAKIVLSHIGKEKFDYVIVNNAPIRPYLLERYRKEKSEPVRIDREELSRVAKKVILENVVDQTSEIVRHNESIAHIIARI
ncbi:MAG: YvcK family protein [Candidatus Taylorbacteria bacterium]|nr:YvcK family protein [Candidatus Taylorbacteria bacterium]